MRRFVLGMILSTTAISAQETQQDRPRLVTLDECIKAALEKNLSIRVESYTPQITATSVKSAESVFDPAFKASVQDFDSRTRTTDIFSSSQLNQADFDFSFTHLLKTSTSYSLSFSNSRLNRITSITTVNPRFDLGLTLRITQPVLKNFGPSIVKTRMLVAMKDREASEQQFRSSITNILTQVQQVYWNFVNSLSNLEVQRQSLKLAQDLLEQNKIRVQVGTLAPIDILQSEAEVASREEAIILAENSVQNFEDQLKTLMNLPGEQEDWSTPIRPADKPEFALQRVSEEEMVSAALEKRPDILQAKIDVQGKEINVTYTKNQLRPDLSLFVQAGTTGVGGNLFLREDDPPYNVIGVIPGGYGDALSDLFKYKNPNWTVGFNFTLPLGNNAAEAAHEQAALAKLQSALRIKNVEQQIYQEVRNACRQLETGRKRVEATQAALRLAEKKLEAEQKKYSVGLSTNYFVLQFQKDLTQAHTNELQAITDYKLALVNLDKVTGMMLERNNVEVAGYLKK